jgi:hypothetical protein
MPINDKRMKASDEFCQLQGKKLRFMNAASSDSCRSIGKGGVGEIASFLEFCPSDADLLSRNDSKMNDRCQLSSRGSLGFAYTFSTQF